MFFKVKKKKDKLIFEAIKYKYAEDADGEATLMLKISERDKLSAFAVPARELLGITVEIKK